MLAGGWTHTKYTPGMDPHFSTRIVSCHDLHSPSYVSLLVTSGFFFLSIYVIGSIVFLLQIVMIRVDTKNMLDNTQKLTETLRM